MLPRSHVIPIKQSCPHAVPGTQLLADAFSQFIAASSVLEASYRDLQREVARLSSELTRRNAALTHSLAANERMRTALQQMLDSLPCGVLVLNRAGRIVMINPEGRRLLELGDAAIDDLKELSRISHVDFGILAAGTQHQLDSEICVQRTTEKRWLAVGNRKLSCSPLPQDLADADAHLESIWILRDITASKQAEQEREAARRATVLAEISTILAHEIRNPLASLELFAGLIEEDPGSASQWISHLRAGIRTLSGTVNNVLSLNGENKVRLVPLDLIAVVRSGVDFVRPIAEQAGLALEFSAIGAPAIQGNEEAVRQMILNIVCNAIRHTAHGGTVRVSVCRSMRDGTEVAQVEIADSGCGITENAIEHIFDAGFSAAGETPGLGLAVCRRLMLQHGGTIDVTSQLGQGSTFRLEFAAI